MNLTKILRSIGQEYRPKGNRRSKEGHLKPVGLQRQLSREEQKSLNCAIANGPLMQKQNGVSFSCSTRSCGEGPFLSATAYLSSPLGRAVGWMRLDYGNLGCKKKMQSCQISYPKLHPPSTNTDEIKKTGPKTTSKSSLGAASLALVLGYVMECYVCGFLVMGVVMVTSRADGKNCIEDSI